ncbi:MAG: cell wall-binding repeat-containing protein, partial [Actinomycetia bacterium]|nr:cell wall-binding repeat-containing protein [Actinomycetes bacterium]
DTKNEINRLGATYCFILGNTGAVSNNVKNQILNRTSISSITRIGGINRYETAQIISEKLEQKNGSIDTAVIATGENYPDALSVSPLAGFKGYPILLTLKDTIPSYTQQALDDLGITDTIITGGTGVVSNSIQNQLPSPIRKSGANRYATSAEIARYAITLGLSWDTMLIATGDNYPDALTGGAFGSRIGAPMLLVNPNNLDSSPEIKNLIVSNKTKADRVIILGETGAVSANVESQLESIFN